MSLSKVFGKSPSDKVIVRVQEIVGGKIVNTRSAAVYGGTFMKVLTTIDEALTQEFDVDDGDSNADDEDEAPPSRSVAKRVAIQKKSR